MQKINQLLSEKNLQHESAQAMTLQTNSKEKQGPNWKLYIATVTRLVLKTVNLANAPALTEQELGLRVRDWADFLWDHVPQDRLIECLDRAADQHDSGFPISAYEIRAAWRFIQTRDAEKAKADREALKEANPVENCSMKMRHVNSLGEIEILYGGPGGIEANVPCPFCRPYANKQACENLAKRLEKPALSLV